MVIIVSVYGESRCGLLLRQQGLTKVLEPSEERIGIKAIEESGEYSELEEKAHSIILLSFRWSFWRSC
jgi:hypothetical protein